MTKIGKHFASDPEEVDPDFLEQVVGGCGACVPIGCDAYADTVCGTYADAGRITRQATRRYDLKPASMVLMGAVTSVVLTGAIMLNYSAQQATTTGEPTALEQAASAVGLKGRVKGFKSAVAGARAEVRSVLGIGKANAEADSLLQTEDSGMESPEGERGHAETRAAEGAAVLSEATSEKAEAEWGAEGEAAAQEASAESHYAGECVTIPMSTADADVYAEWEKDDEGTWWASFSTYNGTAVQAAPADDGTWTFYAVTDRGLVEIRRVDESEDGGGSGPGESSSYWTDTATNTIWY